MIDALVLASLPAAFAVLLALGALDDRRFRASLAGPRLAPSKPAVEFVELPSWAATPGPAAWSAGRDAWPEPTTEPAFELPPPPTVDRVRPPTYLSAVSASLDSWERRRRQVYVVEAPAAYEPVFAVEPFELLA